MLLLTSARIFLPQLLAVLNRHASLGNWNTRAMSVELTPSRAVSRVANHWATKSPRWRRNFEFEFEQ